VASNDALPPIFWVEPGAYCSMPNKTFLVLLRSNVHQHVRATRVEVHGNHLVFLTAKGKLASVFLLDLVESWNEIAVATGAGP
jgi:hypothetical protein